MTSPFDGKKEKRMDGTADCFRYAVYRRLSILYWKNSNATMGKKREEETRIFPRDIREFSSFPRRMTSLVRFFLFFPFSLRPPFFRVYGREARF